MLGNLAVGIDPERATIYRQSDVPVVAELFLYAVEALRQRYRSRRVGDVALKRGLVSVLNAFLEPIRDRRAALLHLRPSVVEEVLTAGAARATAEAEATLERVRSAVGLGSWRLRRRPRLD